MHDLNGYKAAESALSLVATAPNTVEIRNARTPADIFAPAAWPPFICV